MKISTIRAKSVCRDNGEFIIHAGVGIYDIGFQIHGWGLRVMLIYWHVCIHI